MYCSVEVSVDSTRLQDAYLQLALPRSLCPGSQMVRGPQ
jgi:hypothetical protein